MADLRKVLDALLPGGSAWTPKRDGGFDRLLYGIADCVEIVRAFVGDLARIREPRATSMLRDLEIETGVLPDDTISDSARRAYLHAVAFRSDRTGSWKCLEDALRLAGFDVRVHPNDPPIDPASVLATVAHAQCGDGVSQCGRASSQCGFGGGYLLVNGEQPRQPRDYLLPESSDYWPLLFFIGGERVGWDWFRDAMMEWAGCSAWTAGGGALLTKSLSTHTESGIRSLRIDASGADTSIQTGQVDEDDADLLTAYRMTTDKGLCASLCRRNLFLDGNMEQPGVGFWTAVTATLTKEDADPYAGRYCLRIEGAPASLGRAQQTAILNGKDYRITGVARSVDATTSPRIYSPGVTEWTGTASTDWQPFDVTFTAAGAGAMALAMDSLEGIVEFDSVVLCDDVGGVQPVGHSATPTSTTNTVTPWIFGEDFVPASNPEIALEQQALYNNDFSEAPEDDGWTEGPGWTIRNDGPQADKVPDGGGAPGSLSQAGADSILGQFIPGALYRLSYQVTDNGGGGAVDVTPYVGGTAGTQRLAVGTFVEYIRSGTSDEFKFTSPALARQEVLNISLEIIDEAWRHSCLTIALAARIEDFSTLTDQGIASNRGSIGDGDQQLLDVYRDTLQLNTVVGATSRTAATMLPIAADEWRTIVATRDYDGVNTALRIYVDGEEAATGSWAGAPVVSEYFSPVLGQMGAAEIFNGVLASHVAFYGAAKSPAWAREFHAEMIAALTAGPSASQTLETPVTDARTLTASAWSIEYDGNVGGIPMILARRSDNTWQVVSIGVDSNTSQAQQSISEVLPLGISEVRMICKNAAIGAVHFDDLSIALNGVSMAAIPASQRDKFERLILAIKPVHSWAGVMVTYY